MNGGFRNSLLPRPGRSPANTSRSLRLEEASRPFPRRSRLCRFLRPTRLHPPKIVFHPKISPWFLRSSSFLHLSPPRKHYNYADSIPISAPLLVACYCFYYNLSLIFGDFIQWKLTLHRPCVYVTMIMEKSKELRVLFMTSARSLSLCMYLECRMECGNYTKDMSKNVRSWSWRWSGHRTDSAR